MALKSFEFVVSGSVQGVGFRYFVRGAARADGIVGWVKNHPVSDSTPYCHSLSNSRSSLQDGTVLGLAQGDEASLEKL